MKIGLVVGLAVLSAVLGFVFGTSFLSSPDSAGSSDGEAATIRQLRSENDKLRAENAANAEEAREEEERTRRAQDELAALREEATTGASREDVGPAPDPVPARIPGEQGPAFFADDYEGALREVNWDVVGKNLSQMMVLIPKIAGSLARNESPGADDLGRVQQLNGPLVTAALKVQENLPGVGANGKFSDPSFMINAMSTTLSVAGKPLSEAQANALESTAKTWMARDRRRREAYDESTWLIRQLYEESELKDRFFAEAFSHLSREQVETLSPPDVRGRVRLDIFSSAILFTTLSRPDFFDTKEGLLESTLRGISGTLRLSDEERDQARPMIATWTESLPDELLEHETDALDQHGLIHVSLVQKAARHQERLVKELASTLELDEERRAGMRRYPVIHVPIPRYRAE